MARSRLPSERTHAERERQGGRKEGQQSGWLVGGGACERDQLLSLTAAHEAAGTGGEEMRKSEGGRAEVWVE